MKTYHFPATPDKGGTITLPDDVREALRPDVAVDIVVLVRDGDDEAEDEAWRRMSIQSFFDGYDETDAIYDEM